MNDRSKDIQKKFLKGVNVQQLSKTECKVKKEIKRNYLREDQQSGLISISYTKS
jgi:hypothetical protein